LNYLNAMLGARELQHRQVASSDEGVFLSREGGWVVETPRQSIAWISGDSIHVPDSSLGGVAGTCLAWMIERGEVIRGTRTDLRGLSAADAVFVCNSVRGITPVAEIWDESDSKRLGEFASADHGRVRALQAGWQQSLEATAQGQLFA
jgi:4-amino-4-deoxychorismate lyase